MGIRLVISQWFKQFFAYTVLGPQPGRVAIDSILSIYRCVICEQFKDEVTHHIVNDEHVAGLSGPQRGVSISSFNDSSLSLLHASHDNSQPRPSF